jgi:hypothetical protein
MGIVVSAIRVEELIHTKYGVPSTFGTDVIERGKPWSCLTNNTCNE